ITASHLTAKKFIVDFVGLCRSQVRTLQGKGRRKTQKFSAVRLVRSTLLRLALQIKTKHRKEMQHGKYSQPPSDEGGGQPLVG
ncbi:MAG: hypothetical protein J6L87_01820, partial [Clostridia bacterium]|nr:hypothetical protein [Clostridia bacterium]